MKVLLVDDETLATEDTLAMINWQAHGFEVVATARSGAEGWTAYQREHPDIVLTDISMPGKSGLWLAEQIVATGNPVRILLLTSHADFSYAQVAIQLGLGHYLLKHELNPEMLLMALERECKQLEEEKRASRWQAQRSLRRLLIGVAEAEERLALRMPAGAPQILLLAQQDPMFPDRRKQGRPLLNSTQMQEAQQLFLDVQGICAEGEGGWLAVLAPAQTASAQDALMLMKCLAEKLAVFLDKYWHDPVTVCCTVVQPTGQSLAEIFRQWQKVLPSAFFFQCASTTPVVMPLEELARRQREGVWNKELYRASLAGVQQAVNDMEPESLRTELDALFALLQKEPWDYEAMVWTLHKLDALRLRLAEDEQETALQGLSWSRLSEVEEWMRAQLQAFVEGRLASSASGYSRPLAAATRFIRWHYAQDLSLDTVAEAVGISGIYLSQLFKREARQTFVEYLTNQRIEASQKLLLDGKYKIHQVSELVGFRSSQYFSRVFRKTTGLSPQDYRNTADERQ